MSAWWLVAGAVIVPLGLILLLKPWIDDYGEIED